MKIKLFFNNLGRSILTKDIFDNKGILRRFYKYFLTGILVRLIFIPFFFQRDFLSTYQRVAESISYGNLGYDKLRFFTNMIHPAYLFIIKSIFPAINELFNVLLEKDSWISWLSINSTYNVFTALTLFKLLYLIFDIVCMFLILRLSFDGEPENKLRVFKYWIFNPIIIFVLYIFARHDIIGVFVTLIALLLAKKDRKYWAIIVMGLAVALRFFPILILPVLVLYLVRTKKDYIMVSLAGVSGIAALEILFRYYFGTSVLLPLLNAQHFEYLLAPRLDLVAGSHGSIFIFIAVYIVIILSFLHIKKKSFDIILNYCAMIYLAYLGICFFHPQYMIWVVPFLIIIFVRRKSLLYYHWIQFALLIILLVYWGDLVTKYVFAAIDHKYFV